MDARQSFLPGFEPRSLDRLFLALRPDAEAADRLERLAAPRQCGNGWKGSGIGRRRVSLHGLGKFDGVRDAIAAEAEHVLRTFSFPPLSVAFDRLAPFGAGDGKRAIVVMSSSPIEPLELFRQRLGETLGKAGLGRYARTGFVAHVTLRYDADYMAERAIEPIGWTVRDFVLLHSPYGESRHHLLSRWRLQ